MEKNGLKAPAALAAPGAAPPKKRFESLTDLDEPDELDDLDIVEIKDKALDTARPDYEPAKFAKQVESEGERVTQLPSATYDMLRDSCKGVVAQEVALDEEQIVRPSSARFKIASPKK